MPAATRLNDNCTGHNACPPAPLVEGNPNVIINGQPAGRLGDHYASHGCVVHPGHQDVIAAGSSKVLSTASLRLVSGTQFQSAVRSRTAAAT